MVFQKLAQIGNLFKEETKPEHYYKNKMLKKLKSSKHHGQAKLVNYVG